MRHGLFFVLGHCLDIWSKSSVSCCFTITRVPITPVIYQYAANVGSAGLGPAAAANVPQNGPRGATLRTPDISLTGISRRFPQNAMHPGPEGRLMPQSVAGAYAAGRY
jgi:hypothetical protein